ncbi:MAG: hypothetical protein V3W20_11290 [Candidatus Neomarinimicrobiota bacterium]
MKNSEQKKIGQRKNLLIQRVGENDLLLKECKSKKDEIYEATKDFTLSANKTNEAIKKMRELDSEIKKITNKIMRDRREYSEL